MNLPYQINLPVHLLAACFNKTSATYKFYWFLSILNRVEQGDVIIKKHHLFADMVAHAWYTVNYFHVSFGKQDKLQQAIAKIQVLEGLTVDADRSSVYQRLISTFNTDTVRELWYFNAEVPHRFLSPWFRADDMKSSYQQSLGFNNNCLYAIEKENIEINAEWLSYLKNNAGILRAFCYWNLAVYLQTKNPNVPDIPNKLIKSPIRKPLTQQRKIFWDVVISELGSVDCIYTNSRLHIGTYAVEHFLPYAFVSHDLIWNLIPANPTFNSTKSDRLPQLDKYFDQYFNLQQSAIQIISEKSPDNKFLQDYLTILPGLEPEFFNKQRMIEQIQPLITIASNNGFQFMN